MFGLFGVKVDTAKLEAALAKAKKAGLDGATLAAAEAQLATLTLTLTLTPTLTLTLTLTPVSYTHLTLPTKRIV